MRSAIPSSNKRKSMPAKHKVSVIIGCSLSVSEFEFCRHKSNLRVIETLLKLHLVIFWLLLEEFMCM